ncbi:hypothetical protein [Ruegeria arenilitoris]|uniref:hypothetical protein n=1 Tax=Ruegeria arenilitoris TaxID=1173585 RepID=UPI00147F1F92|nr:hypothetical protein [Ruegeria arenilitoris]
MPRCKLPTALAISIAVMAFSSAYADEFDPSILFPPASNFRDGWLRTADLVFSSVQRLAVYNTYSLGALYKTHAN